MTKTTIRFALVATMLVGASCGSDGGGGTGGKGGSGKGGTGGGAGRATGTGGAAGRAGAGGASGIAGTAGAAGGHAGGNPSGAAGSAGGAGGHASGGQAGAGGGGGVINCPGLGGYSGGPGAGFACMGMGIAGAAGGAADAPGGAAGSVGGTAGSAGGGPGSSGDPWLKRPPVPAEIAAPGLDIVRDHYFGSGWQIYTCQGGGGAGGSTYAWVSQPSATLYDRSCAAVGKHQAGPSWAVGCSTVTATKVAQVDSPSPGNIPWLLLEVDGGPLLWFSAGEEYWINYIQRMNTQGGVAPSTPCDNTKMGTVVEVPYSADYFFVGAFASGGAGGGGTGG